MRTLVVFAVLLLSALKADAQVPRIVLIAPEGALHRHLSGELEALGMRVEVSGHEALGLSVLTELARARDAIGAIQVRTGSEGVEIWVIDRVTGKTSLREVSASGGPGEVAVRAVELLRASLMEIEAPHPSRGEVEASASVRDLVRDPFVPRPWTFGAALVGGGSPPALGAGAWLRLDATWRVDR